MNDATDPVHSRLSTSAVIVDVPCVIQEDTWDCGLACCTSVAAYLARDDDHQRGAGKRRDLAETGWRWVSHCQRFAPHGAFAPSTWTIELLLLLAEDPAIGPDRLQMTTTATDVSDADAHGDLVYYAGAIEGDRERLRHVVAEVARQRIAVATRHVAIKDVIKDLSNGSAVFIALVDALSLRCECSSGFTQRAVNALACVSQGCTDCGASTACCCCCAAADVVPFAGHFVLLCGFDPVERLVIYRDPAKRAGGLCCTPITQFERARRRRGTDEDLIRVSLEPAARRSV